MNNPDPARGAGDELDATVIPIGRGERVRPTDRRDDEAGIGDSRAQGSGAQESGTQESGTQESGTQESGTQESGAAGVDVVGAVTQTLAEAADELMQGVGEELLGTDWRQKVTSGLDFVRRRLTGSYEIDTFGFDEELTDAVLLPSLRPLFRDWFRTEVRGVDHIPADGAALVVANHSGTLPLDGLMTQLAVYDHHEHQRHLRLLAADLVFKTPFSAELARKSGATLACAEDAEELLARDEVVGVFPEGFKGIGKPFSERYKLQRFGRGGFVSAALRTGAPIVPCAIVGAEESYPLLGNLEPIARLFGLPYLPVTPTFPWLGPLGLVPLPAKWMIAFGEPIPTAGYGPEAADDPMLVFDLTDEVRETIQHMLYALLLERGSAFRRD